MIAATDAGAQVALTGNIAVGLRHYNGQIGSGVSDHGIRANLTVRF
ncbi:hypothetical protein [Reyranella sp. CPCC 100927]|nr:hypothetical protein [Reyranella sp. CPCC 100927]